MGSAEERELASRWVEETQRVLGVIAEIISENHRLHRDTAAAEDRLNRLTGENLDLRDMVEAARRERDQLHGEIAQLQAELQRFRKERDEISTLFNQVNDMMNQVTQASRALLDQRGASY
jgi:predicted  nucleic acid-binding Zn-ribbon protein